MRLCQNSLNVGTCLWHVGSICCLSGLTSQSDVPTSLKSHILIHRPTFSSNIHMDKKSPPGQRSADPAGVKRGGYLLSHFRSTIGVAGFNFSVRNGKRWSPRAIATLMSLQGLLPVAGLSPV